MKKLLEVKNVSKVFKDDFVVKNVSFSLNEKEIIGIIGRNGSGKTVLLKMIAGLYIPTEGEIKLHDIYIQEMGILIDTGFLPNKTGLQNLEMLASLNKKITLKECHKLLEFVGLDPFSKIKYRNFSTGMKQRLALAQSIMENPKFIILDEPFNGIDKETVVKFRELILELKNQGKTIIITSHNHEDITLLCDRVYEMDKGALEEVKL